jgi:hypothetical protein
MVARCRNVEDTRMDMLGDSTCKLNNNYYFWHYREILELNRQAANATRDDELIVEGGTLTFGESEKSKRRKNMTVFNTTEKLNKHPSVSLNYLRVLVEGKGMKWQAADEEAPPKPPQTNYRLTAIMNALDIDNDVFEDIGLRKKMGKTTTDENFQWEKMFWKRYFSVEQLDETVLRNFCLATTH